MENKVILQKIKHKKVSMWHSYYSCGYIPKRMERMLLNRYLHTHVHKSIPHSSQKEVAIQVSINV